MALFNPSAIQKWRYVVNACTMIINGKSYSLEGRNVSSIEIESDFLTNTFSILKVVFLLDNEVYYAASQNKTTLKINLNLQKYFQNPEKTYNSPRKDFINATFATIEDDLNIQRDSSQLLLKNQTQTDSTYNLKEPQNELELYLYREEVATTMKTQINEVLVNTTLTSAIGYLLTKGGVNNCLISPLENNKTYDTMLLPPLTVSRCLAHLDAYYGFYKTGSIIFFDFLRSYILKYKGGCTAYESGEKQETVFLIPLPESDNTANAGSVDNDSNDKYYIAWQYDKVTFSNKSVSTDVLKGTDAVVVNATDGTTTTSSSNTVTNGSSNKAVIENTTDNEWLGSTYTAQTSSSSVVVSGTIADFDISALAPNKKMTLVFEDGSIGNKYNGTYFLTSVTYKFLNENATGDFQIAGAIELRKM